ncbi:uncharacterized protein LOC114574926, partial [Exaiptasia diaphana]|uniref:C2H2-type domain-containing protein n=1 Tax=Exaiptasia diaphana TaxID=2652724 RepID=A0A913YHG2_EXADI
VHVTHSSTVADHCKTYALSYPKDKDFITTCDHEHKERCDRCVIFPKVVSELTKVIENLHDGDEKDQLKFELNQAKQKIDAWKAHIIRSINQDQARLDIINNLGQESALLVLDWAMKFLPRKFRESQSDWFGKRGISWHITVAARRNDEGNITMVTFVHIFEKCSQISATVLAIIDDVFSQLKSFAPEISTVFLRQDNAGCYHSAEVLLSINQIGTKHNLRISMDFSDPQGGKGSCDRKAAGLKAKMKVHLNEGNDIETAEQMVAAIEAKGGVPGVRVRLCGPQSEDVLFTAKWEGISFLNNMKFSDEGITVRRAYGIGTGKMKKWKDFNLPKNYHPPSLTDPHEMSDQSALAGFSQVIPRHHSKQTQPQTSDGHLQQQDTAEEDPIHDDNPEAESLFFCSEAGCVKSFQKLSALENHLDCGRHKYALEQSTMFDKAMQLYASKLEEGATTDVPQITPILTEINEDTPMLQMGWALKNTKEYKRLTEKQ